MNHKILVIDIYEQIKSSIFSGRENVSSQKIAKDFLQCVNRSDLNVFCVRLSNGQCFMKPEMVEILCV